MATGAWEDRDDLVAVLSAATRMLRGLPNGVHRLTGADLDVVLPIVDELAAMAAAGRFTIARDAQQRGHVAASQAGSVSGWVAERCPSLDAREAAVVGKAVRELASPRPRARLGGGRGRPAVGRGRIRGGVGVAAAGSAGRG